MRKKVLAVLLAGTMALAMGACGQGTSQRRPAQENLLQGRLILEKQILRPEKLLMKEKRWN